MGALALGGCSSWFSSNSGEKVIEPDKAEAKPASGPDVKGATQKADNENYPNLADVPKRPPVTPPDQRIIIEEGLLADRANARYTDQQPRWQTDTGNSSAYVPPGGAAQGAPAAGGQADSKMRPAPTTGVTEVPAEGGKQMASAASPATATAGAQVGTIVFAEDSTELPGSSAAVLEQVAAAYKSRGGTLRVVGHSTSRQRDPDPEKDKVVKFDLSLARANQVAAALVNLGVEQSKIAVVGLADTEPAAGGASGAANEARVDVFLAK
ncbi:MAG: OmpA family protein [Candidatus Eiseniibacteriota bacterium]